jgi:hypothetical protein
MVRSPRSTLGDDYVASDNKDTLSFESEPVAYGQNTKFRPI